MRLDGFFQIAYVCRDVDKGVQLARERHGITGDKIYFNSNLEIETTYAGRGLSHTKTALFWVGDFQIEIVQPVSGLIQHYINAMPEDDSLGFHHICMRVADWEQTRREIELNEWPLACEGGAPGVNFCYIDARDTLGHFVEYVWMSPEMWTVFRGENRANEPSRLQA